MTYPNDLQHAILETLAYSDIFEYPLRIEEIHRYLPMRATVDEIRAEISRVLKADSRAGYYFIKGHDDVVDIRTQRYFASLPALKWAVRCGRILGSLPFVRMAVITGSLAVLNLSKNADMDYMLVTQPGHLWIARAFAVTFGRLMRPFGPAVCVNLLVSENALAWPLHDLYSAREMCQMIPVTGMDVYQRLRAANVWTESILPNSSMSAPDNTVAFLSTPNIFQSLFEFLLNNEYIESQARKFQMRIIARRFDAGSETNFTTDVCQGNFHNHRSWAGEYFRARLVSLGIAED